MPVKILEKITQRPEIIIIVLMVAIMAMLIIPMPTPLIDGLLSLNICISILLFVGTFYIQRLLDLSALPSLLLITTLFRLALSISTSRLILVQADAGEIISAFGNFVIAGDIVVGLIIFFIITIFQFIVITKGSERVAEVCARFSLDGMPGKQMSIDADLRAGTIDSDVAQQRRTVLEKESQLFGALDGTMKFIKGDAIAGIVIILVNLLGGISIGMLRHGLSFSDATHVYTILTIGDALVAQIPALLISIGTGLVVTRVSEDGKNLGQNIISQLFKVDFVLIVTALIAIAMGFLPGFPLWAFCIIAIGLVALYIKRYRDKKQEEKKDGDISVYDQDNSELLLDSSVELEKVIPEAIPLLIIVAPNILSLQERDNLSSYLMSQFYIDYGIQLPQIRFKEQSDYPSTRVAVMINEILAGEAMICFGSHQLLEYTDSVKMFDVAIQEVSGIDGQVSHWVPVAEKEKIQHLNHTLRSDRHVLNFFFQNVISSNIKEFFGIQESKNLLDKLETKYPELLKEVYRHMSVQRVAEVLQRLVQERVSVRNMKVVLESLALWAGKERDTIMLVEHVRSAMSRYISSKFSDNSVMRVLVLSPVMENMIRKGIRQSSSGTFINLEPEDNEEVMNHFQSALTYSIFDFNQIVLLTAMDIRRFVKKLIEKDYKDLEVISFGEVSESVKVEVIRVIGA